MLMRTQLSDKVQTWTITDPKHGNALGPKLFVELDDALKELESVFSGSNGCQISKSVPVRVLVIRAQPCGNPKNPICIAGGNLLELSQLTTKREGHEYALNYARLGRRIMSLPIPVMMVIDGLLIGGGIEFMLFGDIRIASARSQFHFKQLGMGLSAGFASTARLSSFIGVGRSAEYMLLERKISASEAQGQGITGAVVEETELDGAVNRMTAAFLAKDFNSLSVQKEILNRQFLQNDNDMEQDLRRFRSLWMEEFHSKCLYEFLKKE